MESGTGVNWSVPEPVLWSAYDSGIPGKKKSKQVSPLPALGNAHNICPTATSSSLKGKRLFPGERMCIHVCVKKTPPFTCVCVCVCVCVCMCNYFFWVVGGGDIQKSETSLHSPELAKPSETQPPANVLVSRIFLTSHPVGWAVIVEVGKIEGSRRNNQSWVLSRGGGGGTDMLKWALATFPNTEVCCVWTPVFPSTSSGTR